MKTKKGKKVTAIVMALLMVIGIMPMEWATQTVAAETATEQHTFDATTIDATGVADKDVIAQGTTYAEGYFKVVDTVTQRIDSNTGLTKSVELAKAEGGSIQFTTTQKATVTVEMSSTGGSNTSPAGLVDATGTLLAEDTGITTVAATSRTTLTYTDLPAGTYRVVSPENAEYGRGARVYTINVEEDATPVTTTYEFECAALDVTALGVTADKAAVAEGTTFANDYVKSLGANTYRTKSSSDFSALKAIELAKNAESSLQFTVTGTADVTFEASSTGSSNVSPIALVDASGAVVAEKTGITTVTGTSATVLTYEGLTAGTYNIVAPANADYNRGARILSFKAMQTSSGEKPARADWSTVVAPAITSVTAEGGTVTVAFTGVIGYDGADKIIVTMSDSNGEVGTESFAKDSTEGSVTFTPAASGDYTFAIAAVREEEADKAGEVASFTGFELPLTAPIISSATSKGNGAVEVIWSEVTEATSYEVSYSSNGTDYTVAGTTENTAYTVAGLEVGTQYTFRVVARRLLPAATSEAGTVSATVAAEAQTVWSYSAFGQGVSLSNSANGYSGSANEGSVRVWSLGNKGKLVPASTDGLSFYYTAVPADQNFTLTATATVNSWTYTNGQEGFGLMAADAVGESGDASVFWNNSYMASVTKVEYYADAEGNVTDDTTAAKVSMKLGVGAQEKIGVTQENLDRLYASDTATINNEFKTAITALETSCATKGAGTYNIVGGYSNTDTTFKGTVVDEKTTFKLTIQKNNTGYFVTYTDENGNETTKKYYDLEALNQIDPENVYVGFFASRTFDVSFSDIALTIVDPSEDEAKEERPVTQVTPSYAVLSGSNANTANYTLSFMANADGVAVVRDANNTVIAEQAVTANTKYDFNVQLTLGNNRFTVTMTPDSNYKPSEYEVMANYDVVTVEQTVTYNNFDGDVIYVGPEGTSSAAGTRENPVDIYTATRYAAPGQTIVLLGGTYSLTSTVKVERGVNGTADQMITMMADPEATQRPVLDFNHACEGVVIAGNYWYMKGFDVTNSLNGKDGLRLSGSNCTLDDLHTYFNGNTGIQISRYVSTDTRDLWPANNLVLNCTSYNNADAGYEDADGFAAKLTIGEGNVFDGCIAHHNADDGWDLFAKSETGAIGSVTIKNCVAYANGYLLDGTDAGNGNGFKMGGSSITGYHKLINSVAFDNKAKGIDSNSCPDIQVTNSISFNNGGSNVAFYTNDAANTDFAATGIISFRTQGDAAENFKLKGTQDLTKVYNMTNYFWNCTEAGTNNSNGLVTDAWFESVNTYMDYTTHTYTADPVSRNADNSINMNGLLVLTDAAVAVVGAENACVVDSASSAELTVTGETTTGLVFKTVAADEDAVNGNTGNGNAGNGEVAADQTQTGDTSRTFAYVMMLMAAAGLALVGSKKKKNA